MFGLFKKSAPSPHYKVYATEVDKYRQLIKEIEISLDQHMLVYHFHNTLDEMERLLAAAGLEYSKDPYSGAKLLLVDAEALLSMRWPVDYWVKVVEIYPLSERAAGLMYKAKEQSHSLEFYTAIDSPFFNLFGGERMQHLMHTLGIKGDEAIEHGMVNKAIRQAQDKIKAKLQLEVNEKESIERWMEVNKVNRE